MRSGVAVEDTDDTGIARFGYHRTRVILCITRVHNYRHAKLSSKRQLFRERAPLLLARRIVVVIVEAALSYRYRSPSNQ